MVKGGLGSRFTAKVKQKILLLMCFAFRQRSRRVYLLRHLRAVHSVNRSSHSQRVARSLPSREGRKSGKPHNEMQGKRKNPSALMPT